MKKIQQGRGSFVVAPPTLPRIAEGEQYTNSALGLEVDKASDRKQQFVAEQSLPLYVQLQFVAEESLPLYLCALICYSVTTEAYKEIIDCLRNRNIDEFVETARIRRRSNFKWKWPLPVYLNDGLPSIKPKPSNILKRFWLRNNQEGQWNYII